MLQFSENEIRKAIDVLCHEFDRKGVRQNVYIIIVGAASLILKFRLKRATSDIDILERISADCNIFGGLGQLLSRMGFHIVSEAMLNLHPDYSERLELYEHKGLIHVLTLHPYDLAISKIARGFDKDMTDLKQIYLDRLAFLIHYFDNERRERFYPFYLIFSKAEGHCRFREALSIGKYFLDHALLNTEEDELFFETLKKILDHYKITDSDYWYFAEKTPIPMQDYLKAVYDLIPIRFQKLCYP